MHALRYGCSLPHIRLQPLLPESDLGVQHALRWSCAARLLTRHAQATPYPYSTWLGAKVMLGLLTRHTQATPPPHYP